MHNKALKYVIVESTGSGVVNGILNCAAAFLLFHGRGQIPIAGPLGLVRDLIGETFLVASLSYMAAALISRQRHRAGNLPTMRTGQAASPRNIYLWSLSLGILFTSVLVPMGGLLLPRAFPEGISFMNLVLFKTLLGAVLGSIATWLAIHRALSELHPLEGLTS